MSEEYEEPQVEPESCEECGADPESQEWDGLSQVYVCNDCGAVS